MKKHWFITVFICTHVLFTFLNVHKNSNVVKQLYRKQHQEKIKEDLLHKKQQLMHQLYALQQRTHVRKFAQENLAMVDVSLNQIKKIANHA